MPKKFKKRNEELPSFLRTLTSKPRELDFPSEETNVDDYLGPLFFGGCYQQHPPAHSLTLGSFHKLHFTVPIYEHRLENVLLPKVPTPKTHYVSEPFHPRIKRPKYFVDPYLHQCPGARKAFVPEFKPPVIDFGETDSKIYGETSREIPIYRVKDDSVAEEELDILTPSDIREKRRVFMSPQERAVHAHFPKEFATIPVIGPTIPASITITQLPSKRKRLSDRNSSSLLKIMKTAEDERGNEEAKAEVIKTGKAKHKITIPATAEEQEEKGSVASGSEVEEGAYSDKESQLDEEIEETEDEETETMNILSSSEIEAEDAEDEQTHVEESIAEEEEEERTESSQNSLFDAQ